VKDAQDVNHPVAYSARDNEGRPCDDQFTRSRHAAGAPELGVLGKQLVDVRSYGARHLTLKLETTKPAGNNFLQPQAKFDDFIDCYTMRGRTRR
jgi:hypothetical protein